MKDVHEDVQKHAKRVSHPLQTRSKARAAPVDHPESTVEDTSNFKPLRSS